MTFQSPGHLAWQVRIVDEQGRPTPAFLRFIQQLTGNDASTDGTAKQALDGLADKQPADNDLTALSTLAGTGIAVRSATDTWSLRTLQAGTGISITNSAGIAGDPSIACTISQYTDEQAQDAVATMLVAGTNITLTYNDTLNTLTIDAAGGGGSGTVTTTGSPSSGALAKFSGASSITNADLTGDVTTSGGLATTIAAKAVTLAKMADVATSTVFYRKSAGSGAPEVQTLATLKADLGLTGTNSGDQTITLTGDVTGSGTGSFAATLATSGVTAGTYGDATHVAQVTVDAKGRVTSVSSVAVSGGGSGSAAVRLNGDATAVNSPANTSENNLQTYSLPGGTMASDGQIVHIVACGTFAATTRSRSLKLYWGSTVLSTLTTTSSTDTTWQIEAWVVRTGAASQFARAFRIFGASGATAPASTISATKTETLSSAITIKTTATVGSGAVSGDIVSEMLFVEFLP